MLKLMQRMNGKEEEMGGGENEVENVEALKMMTEVYLYLYLYNFEF